MAFHVSLKYNIRCQGGRSGSRRESLDDLLVAEARGTVKNGHGL